MVKKARTLLKKWYLVGVAVLLVVVAFFIASRIPKKPELGFSRQLFNPGEFRGTIPNVLDTTISRSEKQVEVVVKRQDVSLAFQLPIENTKIKEAENLLAFSSPNGEITTEYSMRRDGLKENIILNKVPKENTFPSTLKTEGLITKISAEGIPVFFDKNNIYQFHFERPYVKDSAGAVSYAVRYKVIGQEEENTNKTQEKFNTELLSRLQTITQVGQSYVLQVIVDPSWLHDPKRVLPITIDPTVVHNTSSTFATGTLDNAYDSGSGASPILASGYQEVTADANTVGLWHMNEASGNVLDSSGNGNTGTSVGASVVPGIMGNARSLNGSSQYISIANTNSLNLGTFTFSAWVKINSFAARNTIVDGGGAANTPRFGTETTTGVLNLYKSGVLIICSSASAPTLGQWTHVAVTYDGSNCNIYINGTLSQSTVSAQTFSYTAVSRYIGVTYGTTEFFNGSIDEVYVGSAIQSSEQIKASASRRPYATYTSPVIDLGTKATSWSGLSWIENGVATGYGETPYSSTGLVAQWNMNERGTATAANYAGTCGSACNATLTGFSNTSGPDLVGGSGWTAQNQRWGAGAIMFDGIDDNVSIPNSSTLNLSTFTYSAWVNIKSFAARNTIIDGGGAANTPRFGTETTTGLFNLYKSGVAILCTSSKPPPLNKWTHVVVSYDGTTCNIFQNGALDKSTVSANTFAYSAITRNIGSTYGSTEFFNGIIDSVQIYSRILPESEILSNYNAANIEFQTRVGNTADPTDGTWEEWKPSAPETSLDSFDSYSASGCTGGTILDGGRVHMFKANDTFTCTGGGQVEVLIVAGGGGGGTNMGGGGGGGGVIAKSGVTITANTAYPVVVGAGGNGAPAGTTYGTHPSVSGSNGGNSSFAGLTAIGGGWGGSSPNTLGVGIHFGNSGGSGGGASGYNSNTAAPGYYGSGSGTPGQGYRGGYQGTAYYSGGGGGAGGPGADGNNRANGGIGYYSDILGQGYYWGGGGGGGGYTIAGGDGGAGGGGGGAAGITRGGSGLNYGSPGGGGCTVCWTSKPGGDGGPNTGGGGGGGGHYFSNNKGGDGGSGIVIVRLSPIKNDSTTKSQGSAAQKISTGKLESDNGTLGLWHFDETGGSGAYLKGTTSLPFATGGTVSYSGGYTIHSFYESGTFTVNGSGNIEVLVVAGGGGGGSDMGGGGGGGGVLTNPSYAVTPSSFAITVGGGGAGSPGVYAATPVSGSNGGNSVFGTMTAIGGGGGGSGHRTDAPYVGGPAVIGGSGGGAAARYMYSGAGQTFGAAGTVGQGTRGGNSPTVNTNYYAGGGGGAGGNSEVNAVDGTRAGHGGPGIASSILGTTFYFGAGGGGGAHSAGPAGNGGQGGGGGGSTWVAPSTAGTAGTGGIGIGQPGSVSAAGVVGGAGGPNTGSGGGGGNHQGNGGAGGSGVVIVRYPTSYSPVTITNAVTPTGATLVKGISGNARSFNAASAAVQTDYINTGITNTNSSKFSTAFTADAWLYPTAYDASHNTIMGQETGFLLAFNSVGTLASYINTGSVWSGSVGGACTVPLNKWSYIALTYDGTTINAYLNGSLCGSTAKTGNMASSSLVYIGMRDAAGTKQPFHGSIDQARISNVARTSEEIAENYRVNSNHSVNKIISTVDLSNKTALPFSIAADKPGTYLSATIGESAYENYEPDTNTVGLWHLDDEASIYPRSCYALKIAGNNTSGVYYIDTDGAGGNPPIQVYCNMTYDGGGWTMAVKSWYGSGLIGTAKAVGTVAYATTQKGNAYKLDDQDIRNIIGPGNNFDVMADQNGYNSAYSTGNYEYVVIRNYTGYWTYEKAMPASLTTTTFQSYRASDNALAWTGNITCGYDGGYGAAGINCLGSLGVTNPPQGGAGCAINMGSASNAGWYHFFMNQYNDDTYMYICNGAQHSSGQAMNHRFWIRERYPAKATVKNSSEVINAPTYITATGGTISYMNGYTIHKFTSSGTFQVTSGSGNVEAMVVGGGGGGANTGGGGGAGGYVYNAAVPVTTTSYSVTVGNGGPGGASAGAGGTSGGNSVFSTITALGGGGGSTHGGTGGLNGGSGGGGAVKPAAPASTAGIGSQGSNGGIGFIDAGWVGNNSGGGGYRTAGGAGSATAGSGEGGMGILNAIGGSRAYYAGGGGGGPVNGTQTGGAGGVGGGGASGYNTVGAPGTANTGGGGGGGSYSAGVYYNGGAGGSGIVIIRYPNSSIVSNTDSTAHGTTLTKGRIGNARKFNGTTDYISIPNQPGFDLGTGDFNFSFWAQHQAISTNNTYLELGDYRAGVLIRQASASVLDVYIQYAGAGDVYNYTFTPIVGQWYHFALNRESGQLRLYVNGQLVGNASASTQNIQVSGPMYIGHSVHAGSAQFFNGLIDEVRLDNVSRSANEIQSAYESGLRSHSITINFGAKLDAGNLIANSGDLAFTVDATSYGLNQKGSNLYPEDKIIVRENYDGTEYTAQGTVTSVNPSTGAVTVRAWDGGGTFPTGGYTANADVFKWQKEYWNITASQSIHRNATDLLTLRFTDGNEARTVWIDDLKSSGGYLSNAAGSSIASSLGDRYFQYRTIFHSSDEAVSANLTSVTLNYNANIAPAVPTLDSPINGATAVSRTPTLQTTTTDINIDYLRYKIELCTNLAMTTGCQTFDQTSSQTGWSGQNTETNTAYVSGMQASYTISTPLNYNSTYYWRSYAIDPNGTNVWTNTQAAPFSFTTLAVEAASSCKMTRTNSTTNTIEWVDVSANETGYRIQRNVNNGGWVDLDASLNPNTVSYVDNTVQMNNSYQYRVASYIAGPQYSTWCTTQTQSINEGILQFGGGFSFSGITIQ